LKLEDAIELGRKRHSTGVLKNNKAQINRPVTVPGLCRFFNFKFEHYDYGVPPALLKNDTKKLSGFIKVLRNNNYADANIYELIEKYISSFEYIKRQELYTSKGKKYEAGVRPNIRDLIYCRDAIINLISQTDTQDDNKKVDWSSENIGEALNNLEKW
jgi:hypothetical protein